MAVYDRWHKDPGPDDKPCGCGRGRNKLYPSAQHLKGKRWQVRWDDPNSATRRQPRRNFELRDPGHGELPDPERHASAFDRLIQGEIVTRTYRDPNAGNVTLREYGEDWRKTRGHSDQTAAELAAKLRNHVYEDPARPGSGRAPRGALSIGQHTLATLEQRPTLAAAWVTSLRRPLPAESTRHRLVDEVTAMLDAAVEDSVILRNPLRSSVVDKPGRGSRKPQPFTAAEVAAMADLLPPHLKVMPRLGAGTGMRMMELAAAGTGDLRMLGKRPRVRVERQLKNVGGRLVLAPIKNRKPHDVPLAPSLGDALAAHLAAHPAVKVTLPWHDPENPKEHGKEVTVDLVLHREDGTPLVRSALRGAWSAAAAKATGTRQVKGHNIHRLRHTYASAQLRAGVDVVRVAAAMGDTVDVIVKTYAHLMPDDADADAALRAAVDGFFDACAPDVPSEGADGASSQAE